MRRLLHRCPIAGPAGLGEADPKTVVSGVLDILRFGKGSAESEKWAKSCMASGECIKACDYGVNPRFLLTMARLAIMRNDKDPTERARRGVMQFRKVGEDTSVLSRLQLSEESLIRLGPEAVEGAGLGRTARRGLLHRLQRAEDAAHRAALPRHHGHDRHRL
jgi:Fe-S oxidoreductase